MIIRPSFLIGTLVENESRFEEFAKPYKIMIDKNSCPEICIKLATEYNGVPYGTKRKLNFPRWITDNISAEEEICWQIFFTLQKMKCVMDMELAELLYKPKIKL